MYSWRFVTLAAVSKDEQIDRASIPSQLEITRATGERLGGTFVSQYVIDGYSRTAYYNLDDALADIPPLKDCLGAINQYDVLIVKNYDRLGSLGMLLYYYFNQYRKQLYSVQQATQIQDPETYNPASDISVPSMIISASQNQVYRIAKISDAFITGIKKRTDDGYYAKRLPYGYITTDKKTVTIVPHIAQLLAKFPTWYLGGMSTREIAIKANESGVLTKYDKPWRQNAVIYILKSPFYAGKVYTARGRKDKAAGKYVQLPNVELTDGKHEALWSYETHLKILDEFKRRKDNKQFKKVYNLTSVLTCAVCGQKLGISYDKSKSTRMYWKCSLAHVHLKKEYAEAEVIKGLVKLFSQDASVSNPETLGTTDYTDRELSALKRQMSRLDQAYESGAYSVEEFTEKRKAIKAREAELLDEGRMKLERERQNAEREQVVMRMRDLIPILPVWLVEAPPAEVRYDLLRSVKVVCHPDKVIEVMLL